MDAATITAIAALATGIGAGPLIMRAGGAIWTAVTGGVGKKRDEAEKLRAQLEQRDALLVRVTGERDHWHAMLVAAHGRITRLLNVNRDIRRAAEVNEFLLLRNGVQPALIPDLDEDTEGPWSSGQENDG